MELKIICTGSETADILQRALTDAGLAINLTNPVNNGMLGNLKLLTYAIGDILDNKFIELRRDILQATRTVPQLTAFCEYGVPEIIYIFKRTAFRFANKTHCILKGNE